MDLELVEANNEERRLVEHFADLSYQYYGCNSILNDQLEDTVEEISDYLPINEAGFKESGLKKLYRDWMMAFYIDNYALPQERDVLLLTDKQAIRNLPDADKRIRKKWKDRVSDALRRIVNYYYPHTPRGYLCVMCDGKIKKLDLRCLGCRVHYHLLCLQNEQFNCVVCDTNLNENPVNILPQVP